MNPILTTRTEKVGDVNRIDSLQKQLEADAQKIERLEAQNANSTAIIFGLREELVDANEEIVAAEKQLEAELRVIDEFKERVANLTKQNEQLDDLYKDEQVINAQLRFDLKTAEKEKINLIIAIHKLKFPDLQLYCSADTELCYFGKFDNNSTAEEANSFCFFEQEDQRLAEPQTEVAVKFLMQLTENLKLKNVLLGATRGGDEQFRWLSNDAVIEHSQWGHSAPSPPFEDRDKIVMTEFEGEWAWFSAYNDQKDFNFFCQQSIYD